MITSTDAVVLKAVKTGEADRMLTLLSREHGLITAYAKGAVRPKNKLHSCTNLFCYGHFSVYDSGKYLHVSECDLREIFYGLRSDVIKLSVASYFNELTIDAAPINSDASDQLRLLLNTLYFLSEDKLSPVLMKPLYELRTITLAGYMPALVACDVCGTYETDPMYFDTKTGKLFCKSCAPSGVTMYPLSVITAMRHIVFSDLNKVFVPYAPKEVQSLLMRLSENYVLSKLDGHYGTLQFLRTMMR